MLHPDPTRPSVTIEAVVNEKGKPFYAINIRTPEYETLTSADTLGEAFRKCKAILGGPAGYIARLS